MYESFGLIGIQLPEKYKENFDVSREGASTCTVYSVCIHRTSPLLINLLKNEYYIFLCFKIYI
jgi:hypothetical protein